jgi:hypothetical protein
MLFADDVVGKDAAIDRPNFCSAPLTQFVLIWIGFTIFDELTARRVPWQIPNPLFHHQTPNLQ